jgi:hypothetical protein
MLLATSDQVERNSITFAAEKVFGSVKCFETVSILPEGWDGPTDTDFALEWQKTSDVKAREVVLFTVFPLDKDVSSAQQVNTFSKFTSGIVCK